MDHKSWLWKKGSTEKTLIADIASNSLRKCEEEVTEVQKMLTEKTDLERELQTFNAECDAKDNIAKKQAKIAEEAIAGWEKAETETISLKQELDKVLQQKTASEERAIQLDAALKECMHQLRFVREEHEKRIQNAVLKTSQEFEKIKIGLDEKLVEAGKKLAKLEAENTQLTRALSVKEKSIEELSKYKIQVDADFNALRSRVESTKKENACLKYEVRDLEKELDIRNEEREFNRRTGEVASKQKQESFKKIARLEMECQRLRLLVRKQLPSPAALGKMDRVETRTKNLSPTSSMESLKGQTNVERLVHENMVVSDMNLMDDFAEMEKLAGDDVIQTSTNETMNLNPSDARNGNNISIQKILELLEGINLKSQDKGVGKLFDDKHLSYKTSENPTGYTVRVFQWKRDELSAILEQFVQTCNDLLNGTVDLEYFVREVAFNLEWVINHCFSIQDVSSMKDAIMSRLGWDEWRSESEVDSGWANYSAECNKKLPIFRQNMSYVSMVSRLSGNNDSCQMDEEGRIWKVEQANEELEIVTCESKDVIEDLHSEMETMKESEGDIGNQIEKQRMMKEEDLENRVMETNDELRKACRRILDLENELENKNHSCKRLEETCHDLEIQLKCMASKEVSDNGKHWEKQLQNDWEITAASEKLAECQETILNLGKQLKALASPSDAPLFDKVISTPADFVITSRKNINRRSCLLDKMLAKDDNLQTGASIETEKDIQSGNGDSGVSTNGGMEIEISSEFIKRNGIINHEDKRESDIASSDIVPCKRNGGRGFFKKLTWRQKKGNRGKNILLIGCN